MAWRLGVTRDLEKGVLEKNLVKGFPSFSEFIASDRDHSTFVFKRFNRLSARNLLYLQSELAELEARQDEYDEEDFEASMDEKAGRRDWRTFLNRAEDPHGNFPKDKERMKLAEEIREKVRAYREALLLESAFLAMPRPSKQVSSAMHNYFWNKGSAGGSEFPTLLGHTSAVYDDPDDLVALVRPQDEDRLSAFLRQHCSVFFMDKKWKGEGDYLGYISAKRIARTVAILNTLLATVLLLGAILNLYFVRDPRKRLGLITAYTVVFALCLSLFTRARRVEIFSACAAYTAVLVVFVSGDLGG